MLNKVNFQGETGIDIARLLGGVGDINIILRNDKRALIEYIIDAYGALMSGDSVYAENVLREALEKYGGS
jgi:hypothetical protein